MDAIALATPVFTHFDLGMASLNAGKHTFVEKPLARAPTTRRRCAPRRIRSAGC